MLAHWQPASRAEADNIKNMSDNFQGSLPKTRQRGELSICNDTRHIRKIFSLTDPSDPKQVVSPVLSPTTPTIYTSMHSPATSLHNFRQQAFHFMILPLLQMTSYKAISS